MNNDGTGEIIIQLNSQEEYNDLVLAIQTYNELQNAEDLSVDFCPICAKQISGFEHGNGTSE